MHLRKIFAVIVALAIALGLASAPANAALVYKGDWRLVVHQETGDECDSQYDVVTCDLNFLIRTDHPQYLGETGYRFSAALVGPGGSSHVRNLGLGTNPYSTRDPGFGGVWLSGDVASPLTAGAYTYTVNWYYRGVWTCGPTVPEGCAYIGAQNFTKTYRFDWTGANQTVFPYSPPTAAPAPAPAVKAKSAVSISGKRSGSKTALKGVVKTQRRIASSGSATFYKTKGVKVRLESYSKARHKWTKRKTLTSNSRGALSHKLKASKGTKWRFVVVSASSYTGSISKSLKK